MAALSASTRHPSVAQEVVVVVASTAEAAAVDTNVEATLEVAVVTEAVRVVVVVATEVVKVVATVEDKVVTEVVVVVRVSPLS